MEEKIKKIYLVLGIILFVLIIIFLILNIIGFRINPYFFTWSKEDCVKSGGRLGDVLCKERPPLFRTVNR
jgi:hypothetical protein